MAKLMVINEGKKFGHLFYIRDAKRKVLPSGQMPRVARCRCECGRIKNVLLLHLVRGRISSCGSCQNRQTRSSVIGKRFGTLIITKELKDKIKNGRLFRMVEANCDCGKVITRRLNCIRRLKSCGCLTESLLRTRGLTHGKTKTRIYSIWCNMKNRCYNRNVPNYKTYGAKGVRVCKEWRGGFEVFYEWAIKNGYSEDLSLDRFPNKKGNYHPDNCRWATPIQQANNKTNNVLYTYKGVIKTLAEFCSEMSISYSAANARIKQLGWTIDKTLETKIIPYTESLKKAIKTRYGKDVIVNSKTKKS